jgi:sec-independent protein translocase protein TatC
MRDDNLFTETSMSFGEHLEELRKCLFYSIYWIAFGSIFGFVLGMPVVRYIKIPVEKALENYNNQQAVKKIEQIAEKLAEEGYSQEIFGVLQKFKIIPEERWIFPGELERILNRQKILHKTNTTTNAETEITKNANAANDVHFPSAHKQKQENAHFSHDTVHLDEEPIRILLFTKSNNLSRTKALGVYEAFGIYIKASLVVGAVFASPFVAFHLWSFVASGLYPHEKKYVYYYVPVSIILFIGGALFAFFFVFQVVLDFLFGFNALMHIDPDPRISEWIGFALLLPIGFGVSFQLPLAMFVLERVGIFSIAQYVMRWRISILIIFILALLLTPGDPGSMLLMAVPLTVLYFGGIFFCWMFPRKKGIFDFDGEEEKQKLS